MKLKNEKGSITIFVLIGLLFMSAFLIISYASNVNKSKILQEQSDIIDGIYTKNENIVDSYEEVYAAIRKENKQTMIKSSEDTKDTAIVELTKTFEGNLSNYKIYGKGKFLEKHNLPGEYQEVEYIESTGTQYIDIEYTPKGELKFQGKVNTNVENKEMAIIGTTNSAAIEIGFSKTNNRFFLYSVNSLGIIPTNSIYNTELEFEAKLNSSSPYKEISLNLDAEYASSIDENSDYKNDKLQLFRMTNKYYYIGKTYYIKIYDNNVLVRDFIPCYRKLDNVIGMYDLVESKFYTNTGTGNDFIAGSKDGNSIGDLVNDEKDEKYKISIKSSNVEGESITKDIYLNKPLAEGEYIDFKQGKIVRIEGEETIDLPEIPIFEDYTKIEVLTENKPSKIEVEYIGYYISEFDVNYTRLEYIESTGTQYINTEYTPTGNLKFQGKVNTNVENKEMAIIGTTDSTAIELGFSSENNKFFLYSIKSLGIYPINSIYNTELEFEAKLNSSSPYKEISLNLDAEYASSIDKNSDYKNDKLQLFRVNGKADKYYYIGKTYYVKIYDNNILVRDFIPCYRKADKVIGLYDKVNNVFYTNNGTGEFIAGPEV